MENNVIHTSRLTEYDLYLFREGKHFTLYEKLGSHLTTYNQQEGVYFAVWAPNAKAVHVIGDFNGWDKSEHPLYVRQDESGIWEGFIPGLKKGTLYKYYIESQFNDYSVEKGDPFAFMWETPPQTASIVWDLDYEWADADWLSARKEKHKLNQPMSVYEMHLGSWERITEENNRFPTYRELAEDLAAYIKNLGYTHVEFLPPNEHPFYGSWGYQITGYFAPTSRYGTPQDFMYLIDTLHQNDIGVIMDWVPSHFPSDEHGLSYFDGTHLFEHADPRQGYHPEWHSYIFNYGRNEVLSFLVSNALYWFHYYHLDGQRVDGVASMLYLDYGREGGDWIPNKYGGRENLEAIAFLKYYNEAIHGELPDIFSIAEESTSWPMVTQPTYMGGLGFDQKWMMGWMHDTLEYFKKEPIYRQYHQDDITFSTYYAFSEKFMLPLSHDEVVHGKNPLIYKMPGDEWQQFANLRALYGYMFGHPGTKLLFMGNEFGQTSEWSHDSSLDWHLLQYRFHQGIQLLIKDLNALYTSEPALHELNFEAAGFEWIDIGDRQNSIIIMLRKDASYQTYILIACNFTPTVHEGYRIGVPFPGTWKEILNSDHSQYGGSGVINADPVPAESIPHHGRNQSITVTLPPLGVTYLKL